jgi:ABC-2 type transport system ATP-binding protein
VLNLQSEKKTILLTTHYMFEADALCQRIAVINHGKIIALDTPTNLKQIVKELSIVELEVFGVPPSAIKKMKALPFVENVTLEDHDQRQHILVQTPKGPEAVPALMEALEGVEIGKVTIREPTLEDAYVRLVGGDS